MAVTGAGSGIGRAIAKAFVQAGDRVHVGDVSAARLAETAGRDRRAGDVATHVLDVTDSPPWSGSSPSRRCRR